MNMEKSEAFKMGRADATIGNDCSYMIKDGVGFFIVRNCRPEQSHNIQFVKEYIAGYESVYGNHEQV